MNISDKAKKNIYILWLLVVPLGTFLTYQYAPDATNRLGNFIFINRISITYDHFSIFYFWNYDVSCAMGYASSLFKLWDVCGIASDAIKFNTNCLSYENKSRKCLSNYL